MMAIRKLSSSLFCEESWVMRGKLTLKILGGMVLLGLVTTIASADVRLPGVFADHLVLQRDVALPVWGWADPGEKVTVTLAGQTQSAAADSAGKWSVKLAPIHAGGPHVLRVQGKNALERSDLLVGEVWLCSGESNMAMTVNGVQDKDAEIAAADYPQIRLCTVARKTSKEPQSDCDAVWKPCTPSTVGGFSATAYFFGRELHKVLGVPVGLIDSSWDGTPVQAWTSLKAQESVPELRPMVNNFKQSLACYDPAAAQQRFEKALAAWPQAVEKAKAEGKPAPGKPQLQDPTTSPNSPARLYNGMIAPLAPFALRGAIWYQGEANTDVLAASLYGLQLRTMIANWRQDWAQGDFPFLYVQLPNFKAPQQLPFETDGWPIVREQMLQTLAMTNTGMAVTIDIGEEQDIHPKNKQDVGKRLAQWALAKTYGKDVVACGPLMKSMSKQGNAIVIQFDHLGGGLMTKGDEPLKGFAIANSRKIFVWAEAKIVGDTVVVSNPDIETPTAVRYAWSSNPVGNLFNRAGLPASPFRTDDWAAEDVPVRKPDSRYQPTRRLVVKAMLELAQVKKEDVVFDLGCGDGRIVIAAAKDYGARGVGIDIDPACVKEARENARLAGVDDKTEFIVADIFDSDLRRATVVTLFLQPWVNEKLRPKLLRELKPGSRIVSNQHDMGDWKPDKKIGPVDECDIMLWTVPAAAR